MYSSTLLEQSTDTCTLERMAAAGVDDMDAHWYHTSGRHLTRITAEEADRIMRIRFKVCCAAPPAQLGNR